ncbi:hypothetical protein [Lacticaseibacillus hulanensis]|uniref:hypothetical protein n=1 Tax=Lacticaseibacillus hulanensis TaxID=2493111 RepID=UPI000FD6CA81|nr:hypothetical protein [Lacticaseibacillus hulanensis]
MAEEPVTRNQKISGANAIMDFGYVTERTIPEMMDREYAQRFLLEVQDELQLRSLAVPVVMQTFNYYMGSGVIIYNPTQFTADEAKDTLKHDLGYRK